MRCPALSRGLSRAVPRFPAPHFYQHMHCPALSRVFPRPISTNTCAVPRFPAPHFYQHMRGPALSRAFPRLISTRHVADYFQVAMGATQGRLENCILEGSQLGTALYSALPNASSPQNLSFLTVVV